MKYSKTLFVLCILLISSLSVCFAYVIVPNNKMSITGSVTEVNPQNNNYTNMWSEEYLAQKINAVYTNNEGTYQVVYSPSRPPIFFFVDKSVGLLKIETTGSALATPAGDEQQDTAAAYFQGNILVIKITKDIKLNHNYDKKPTRVIKAGSWIKIVFK